MKQFANTGKRLARLLCILCVLTLAITLPGCQQEFEFHIEKGDSGTTCANLNMGEATFAYRDGFLYFCTSSMICEYDMETGKVAQLLTNAFCPRMLHATQHHICYIVTNFEDETTEWSSLTRDGKNKAAVFRDSDFQRLYADGMDVYYITNDFVLHRRDLVTGQVTELLQDVKRYDMDETYLYAVVIGDPSYRLLRARKDTLDFEEIPLSFSPFSVFIAEDALYICSSIRNRPQIYRYADGVETQLPIRGVYYRVLDGCLIYADEDTYNGTTSTHVLKSYNLETGEETVLFEDVATFALLENRYICCWIRNETESWVYYDWQTGERTVMYAYS